MRDIDGYFKRIYESPLRNLNNVVRYSGVFCMKPENDGYHSIDMMAMAMTIADIIESRTDTKVDRRDLIYRCYIHDMDESLMGDISRVIKYYNDDIYNSINNVVDELMTEAYSDELVRDIKSSKDKDNVCGLIVKISDTLQSSMKIYEECKLGNFHFKKIIVENVKFVSNLKQLIKSSKLSESNPDIIGVLDEIISSFEGNLSFLVNNI